MKKRFVCASQIASLVILPLAAAFALTGCGSGSGDNSDPDPMTTPTPFATPTPTPSPTLPMGMASGSITYDDDVITTVVIGTAFTPTAGSLMLPSASSLSSGIPYLSAKFVFSASEGDLDETGTAFLFRKYSINLTPTIRAGQVIDLKPSTQIVFTDISLTLEEKRRNNVLPMLYKALSGTVTVVSIVDSGNTRTYTLLLNDVLMTPISGVSKFTIRGTLTYTGSIPASGSGTVG